MENISEEAIRLPKNICQIGTVDERIKVYFEDYVNVFMKKAESESKPIVGILLGKAVMSGDVPYLFINGAIIADFVKVIDSEIDFSDTAWTSIHETIDKYFNDVIICGWFLCGEAFWDMDIYALKKCHKKNFTEPYQILCHCGELERTSYCFDLCQTDPLAGYHIYYERNADMQDYMMVSSLSRRIEPAAEDRTTKNIRETLKEHREQKSTQKNMQLSFVVAAAMVVMVAVAGITMLMGGIGGNDNVPVGATVSTQAAPAESGSNSVIVETVAGEVYPTEDLGNTLPSEEQPSSANTLDENANEDNETTADEANHSVTASDSTQAPTQAEATDAVYNTTYYTVLEGESLLMIVRKLYGTADMSRVEEICRLNEMENADYIYVGQRLIVPR